MGVRVLLRVALSLLLVGFLFEGAVHSVHHLDDDEQAAECWLASAAGHVSITSPEPVVLDTVPVVLDTVVERDRPGPSTVGLDVARSRAPPFALSA